MLLSCVSENLGGGRHSNTKNQSSWRGIELGFKRGTPLGGLTTNRSGFQEDSRVLMGSFTLSCIYSVFAVISPEIMS